MGDYMGDYMTDCRVDCRVDCRDDCRVYKLFPRLNIINMLCIDFINNTQMN